ncbi:sugar ABC transporter ATP-binding protein [Aliiroseovarius sp. Z3]|uniref:sugar ABC transporter ATP-binding protein n=1 Tax=Aliiroseovarius sp. Z3 TaxID=2811402 RepID=UPI0023B2E8D8|nr:sugar ABC transporter ATP-binding protein [Aliiroseovarius sp. Z3]MDE9451683.1 sugar ABC transporter ATP-binding protein [Aliiroseovarius sp. Z3]
MTGDIAFEMKDITKTFPGIKALDSVSFAARAGEVHALVGENGAGKSTLMKVLSGVYQADGGQTFLFGKKVRFSHPLESLAQGVSVIYQEFSLLPDRTVAENIFLGREPTLRWGVLDSHRMRTETQDVLALFGDRHQFEPDTLVGELDVAQQQMVEIAKALSLNARVIVMDEPTAALNDTECELLFQLVDDLRTQGRSIVYITHRMREIRRLADRVTVIKDGKVAASFDDVPETAQIVEAMVGRDIGHFYPDPANPDEVGEVILAVRNGGNDRLFDINLDLRAGHITGFAGVQGAGRTALALALFGADPFDRGEVTIDGQPATLTSPRQAAKAGIAMLPGDRKADGLVLMQSVRDNGMLSARAFSPALGHPDKTPISTLDQMDRAFDAFDLRAASYEAEIQSLSGGNQQKAIVARWLSLKPKVLIFVEPTRGIDVNTKAGIYAQMRELAQAGAAVMAISSDLPEVLGISDRVLVMSDGKIVAEFGHGVSEAEVMHAATEAHLELEAS